jgi:CubicO group peptidase (beta-lactamase class C family)
MTSDEILERDADDGWTMTSPEEMGVDGEVLGRITERVRAGEFANIHAVLIARGGYLVFEEHFAGPDENIVRLAAGNFRPTEYHPGSLHDVRSVTKSVVSLLYGIALRDHVVPDLGDTVMDAFSEYADLRSPDRERILVRHLLHMTMGVEWDESITYLDPRNSERQMYEAPDARRFVLSRPTKSAPGEAFTYNGGATELLAALVQKGTGAKLDEFARDVLFAPLGIRDYEWARGQHGHPLAASGLRLCAQDLAKIAYLYLTDGQWAGQPVAPGSWLHESLQLHVPVSDRGGYGHQWWVSESARVASAMGNGGQRAVVIPGSQTVAVTFGGNYNDSAESVSDRIIGEHILPALGMPAADPWWSV